MPRSVESIAPSRSAAGRMRRLVYQLRTEASTPVRDAVAVALGAFVGCSPWYGFHLAICWGLGRLLQLNRLKMYLAANVSNPVAAPFLVLGELQVGAWMRRGELHALTLESVRSTDPWTFGADIVIGSIVVGGGLGLVLGLATWLGTRGRDADPFFSALVSKASDRYVTTSITAWEFARGKLRGDPVYRTVVMDGMLRSGGTLVDVGCGQGLMLALLAEAAAASQFGDWPAGPPPPVFDRLVGIEMRRSVAAVAHQALGEVATIVEGDARSQAPATCKAVLFFDVLHMMPAADQEALLRRMAGSLEPDGVIVVREADAAAGWCFSAVRAGNKLKALVFGHWHQGFQYRTADEWRDCFTAAGFDVEARGAGDGTPFGNVLFILTPSLRASA
jgi:uncharacterized protein (DUF2062 family)/2-polyprenyl-3-methyl-5-hydroxy-6-metoxy-1,4-benzoquinol methylase